MSKRWLTWFGCFVIASAICWFFPLFRVRLVSRQALKPTVASGGVDASASQPIRQDLSAHATGTPILEFWKAFDIDPTAAQKQYGRQAGLGGAWYFRVQGTGTIQGGDNTIANGDRVVVSIAGSTRTVVLELAAVVDNTVRESIGIKASQFLNSQDFNALSTELNRQVEEDVIKPNRTLLVPGAAVTFVGSTKVSGKSDLDPLHLIPLQLTIK